MPHIGRGETRGATGRPQQHVASVLGYVAGERLPGVPDPPDRAAVSVLVAAFLLSGSLVFRHSDHSRERSSDSSATVCAVRARELPEPLINTVDDQAMSFANRSVGAILIYS